MLNFLFGKKKEDTKHPVLTVEKIVRETAEAITIHLRQPEKNRLNYEAGQFLTLIADIDGEETRRSYSLCSSPQTDETLAVTVKRIPNGKMSNFLNDMLKEGQTLKISEPAGRFTLTPNPRQARHVVLIGAGSGITPLMSMLKTLLTQEPNSRATLIYGNRTEETIIFRQQLLDFQTQYRSRLQIIHILSQPHEGWEGLSGRLNRHSAMEVFGQMPTLPEREYYLCGPAGMMEEMQEALKILNVPPGRIFKESFVTAQTAEAKGEVTEEKQLLQNRNVTIYYEGTEYKLEVSAKQSILEAALKANIDLPYSCQSGMCTACMGRCVSGKVKLDEEDSLTPAELQAGFILTCVGHPLTDDVVIDID
jgi:ring-1,2-phenylacetyl-CoA epoxidase subunit PaaE